MSVGVELGRVTHADLTEAKQLREAIWQCADARFEGRSLPRAGIQEIKHCARRSPLAPRTSGEFRMGWVQPVTPSRVLSTVARDAVGLFTASSVAGFVDAREWIVRWCLRMLLARAGADDARWNAVEIAPS